MEAEAMPLPRPDTTPPVMKMNFVFGGIFAFKKFSELYWPNSTLSRKLVKKIPMMMSYPHEDFYRMMSFIGELRSLSKNFHFDLR